MALKIPKFLKDLLDVSGLLLPENKGKALVINEEGDGIALGEMNDATSVIALDELGGTTGYEKLMALKGSWVPGQRYQFQYINSNRLRVSATDGSTIYQKGLPEDLIVTVVSPNKLDKFAHSVAYPEDIIIYSPICSIFHQDTHGQILYREDTVWDITGGFDWRNVKSRRWEDTLGSGIFIRDTAPQEYCYVQETNSMYARNWSEVWTTLNQTKADWLQNNIIMPYDPNLIVYDDVLTLQDLPTVLAKADFNVFAAPRFDEAGNLIRNIEHVHIGYNNFQDYETRANENTNSVFRYATDIVFFDGAFKVEIGDGNDTITFIGSVDNTYLGVCVSAKFYGTVDCLTLGENSTGNIFKGNVNTVEVSTNVRHNIFLDSLDMVELMAGLRYCTFTGSLNKCKVFAIEGTQNDNTIISGSHNDKLIGFPEASIIVLDELGGTTSYEKLIALKGTWVPGQKYQFQYTNAIRPRHYNSGVEGIDWNWNQDLTEQIWNVDSPNIHRGVPEDIIVTAATPDELEKEALSLLYPDDVIYYSPYGSDYHGQKHGQILYRWEPRRDIYAYEDWRNSIVRRWADSLDPETKVYALSTFVQHPDDNDYVDYEMLVPSEVIDGQLIIYEYMHIHVESNNTTGWATPPNNGAIVNSANDLVLKRGGIKVNIGTGSDSITFCEWTSNVDIKACSEVICYASVDKYDSGSNCYANTFKGVIEGVVLENGVTNCIFNGDVYYTSIHTGTSWVLANGNLNYCSIFPTIDVSDIAPFVIDLDRSYEILGYPGAQSPDLQIATADTLGLVKIGAGISVDQDGIISVDNQVALHESTYNHVDYSTHIATPHAPSGATVGATWGTDLNNIPSTFAPSSHDNSAHSVTYATVNSPTFTGTETCPDLYLTGTARSAAISAPNQTIVYSTATTTINWTKGNTIQLNLATSISTLIFTPPASQAKLTLKIVHDNTSNTYAIDWTDIPIKWMGGTAITLTQSANAVDFVSFVYDGTNWYAMGGSDFK